MDGLHRRSVSGSSVADVRDPEVTGSSGRKVGEVDDPPGGDDAHAVVPVDAGISVAQDAA